MDAAQARAARMRALLLTGGGPPPEDPVPADAVGDVVTWFGALQGQDVRSLLWSLGVRLPGTTAVQLRAAMERRTVLRTWPMRGTLHLVPAQDARWMVDLMAQRVERAAASRRGQLGLEDAHVGQAVDVLATALAGGGRLTRAACLTTLSAAGIPVAGQAGYHLLAAACRQGVLCMAPEIGTEQTFALLDEWAPGQRVLERDEALATVVVRYLRSHGPARRNDVAGWTGLPLADIDRGVAVAGAQLCPVDVEGVPMIGYAPGLDAGPTAEVRSRLALPGFDELVLGYKDRSLLFRAPEYLQAVVPGGNGMFLSTLVLDGRVVGTWRRTVAGRRLTVDVTLLEPVRAPDRRRFERALTGYAEFAELPSLVVRWPAR
jgi:hypothetical protein